MQKKIQATNHLVDRIYANYESHKSDEKAESSDIFDGAKYQSQSQIQQVGSESTYQSQAQPKSAVFNQSQQDQSTNNASSSIIAKMNSFADETNNFEVVKQVSQNNQEEKTGKYKKSSIDKLKAQRNRLLDSKEVVEYDGMKIPMEIRKKLAEKINKKIWNLIWQKSDDMLDQFLESQDQTNHFK